MTAWVLILVAIAGGGGLRVETGTPDALCPEIGEVRRAVRDRLRVEGEGEWLVSYDLVHRPLAESGDVVRLELRDPEGRLRLRRDLPRSGESCVALAQALVLVLESYFRHPADPVEDERPASAMPAIAAAPAPVPPAPLGRGPAVELLGAWAAGTSSSPALALDVWYGARAPWAFGVEGVWMTSAQRQTIDFGSGQGTGTLRSALLRGWVARRLRLAPPLEVLVGPELVVGLDRMVTVDIPGATSNARAAPGAGGRAHLRLRLAPRVTLSLVAAADVTPRSWAGYFEIGNVAGELFPSPEVRLFIGAGLGVALHP